jgi:hypothetical protein
MESVDEPQSAAAARAPANGPAGTPCGARARHGRAAHRICDRAGAVAQQDGAGPAAPAIVPHRDGRDAIHRPRAQWRDRGLAGAGRLAIARCRRLPLVPCAGKGSRGHCRQQRGHPVRRPGHTDRFDGGRVRDRPAAPRGHVGHRGAVRDGQAPCVAVVRLVHRPAAYRGHHRAGVRRGRRALRARRGPAVFAHLRARGQFRGAFGMGRRRARPGGHHHCPHPGGRAIRRHEGASGRVAPNAGASSGNGIDRGRHEGRRAGDAGVRAVGAIGLDHGRRDSDGDPHRTIAPVPVPRRHCRRRRAVSCGGV